MDELLTMSNREITRLEVMQRIKDKRLTQKEAARMLGIEHPAGQTTVASVQKRKAPKGW